MLCALWTKRVFAVCCVIAAVMLTACGNPSKNTEGSQTAAVDTASVTNEPAAEEEHRGNERIVTFLSDDGSVLQIESIQSGALPTPPSSPELSNDHIFLRWDYTDALADGDVEISPEFQSITNVTNAFVIPSAYGKHNETITVPLRLCGNVMLFGFDLTVEYDTESLELLSVYNEDDSVIYNDEVPGAVRINYISIDNTTADVDICSFKFLLLSEDGEHPILLKIKSVYAWDESGNVYVPEYSCLNGCIYAWKE